MDRNRSELISRRYSCARAREFAERSVARWGQRAATVLIGRHPSLRESLERVDRFAPSESPVLIVGETGVGKELLARALFLFSPRRERPFVVVNCAQYRGSQPIVSELFGHRKGSFTGAVSEHRGLFEAADGGVVFLDEIGELPLGAQAMLLRTLAEGEIVPVGGVRRRHVDVRVVAASNRDLKRMVAEGGFREDLFYRLQTLLVKAPPLRERGRDYELIAEYWLEHLNDRHGTEKRLSEGALKRLGGHSWPGNVRELKSVIEFGYFVSRSPRIELEDIGDLLEEATRRAQFSRLIDAQASDLCKRMRAGEGSFWELVYEPFMKRQLNRREVRAVVSSGLAGRARGSYKRMLRSFGVPESQYLKAMDFLRHHRLKPARSEGRGRADVPDVELDAGGRAGLSSRPPGK